MPDEWTIGIIILISKQGDMIKCANYRSITLLNVTYKIITTIINDSLEQHIETIIGQYQMGFKKGKSTMDAIHMIKQIAEKSYEHDVDLHCTYYSWTINRRSTN